MSASGDWQTTEHAYTEERLSAYLDGELLPQERRAVEGHLATCPACRWNLDTLRQTVRWTREMPTVPLPRSFTLPVPTAPARVREPDRRRAAASRRVPTRRWRLVPVFQGATALVALLLFFAVAGDVLLTGFRPVSMPAPQVLRQEAQSQVIETVVAEVTKEVAAAAEAAPAAAAPAEEERGFQKVVTDSAAAASAAASGEAEVAATAAPEPTLVAASPTQSPVAISAQPPAAMPTESPLPAGDLADGAAGAGSPAPTGLMAMEAPSPMTATGAYEAPVAATLALAQVTATFAPTLLPPPTRIAVAGPTAVARVQESEGLLGVDQRESEAQALEARAITWLRLIEYGLGAALLLLGIATVSLMVWRKARS